MKYDSLTFIKKAKKRHNGKYNYSKSVYVNSLTAICVTCPEHGDFWQTPAAHLRGDGCPKCANEKRGKSKINIKFLEQAKEKHANKYDYSRVEYKNALTKVCIICPEHGEFWQTPAAHLKGEGCPKCAGRNLSTDEYIKKFKEIHGSQYDYGEVTVDKANEKVKIICPIHGAFYQTPSKHLIGQGCPHCAKEKRHKKQFLENDAFIKRSKKLYGETYDYSKVNYTRMNERVEIICPKHGSFFQRSYDHLQGHGCPICGKLTSKPEEEIYNFICEFIDEKEIIRNERTILDGKEIDIFITSHNVGIEFNGLKWHCEENGKDAHYHLDRLILANKKGIRLIQIFEDEYKEKKEIVLNKILHLLHCGFSQKKIMARKCTLKEIGKDKAMEFMNKYHIQGYGKNTLSIGCFYEGVIVGVMSFLKHKNNEWELVRFATNYNYTCQGVGGKLFRYFLLTQHPSRVKTFADRRWTLDEDENFYTKIGFVKDKILKPDYHYVSINNPQKRIHKFNFRKKTLNLRYALPLTLTEREMVEKIGFSKIWDCGMIRYIYKNGEF